jgi:RimJ/RimL family protein N-acetyltransferase
VLIAETDRLVIRKFIIDDAPFIVELLNTAGWLQFIGDRKVKTINDAENYLLKGPIQSYVDNGFGLYMVELKKGTLPIGMCGLIKRQFLRDPDIGFAFLPEQSGKGYGYESALAVLNFAKEKIGLRKILGITSPENNVSINLLKKLNLQFEKMITFPNEIEESMLFSATLI